MVHWKAVHLYFLARGKNRKVQMWQRAMWRGPKEILCPLSGLFTFSLYSSTVLIHPVALLLHMDHRLLSFLAESNLCPTPTTSADSSSWRFFFWHLFTCNFLDSESNLRWTAIKLCKHIHIPLKMNYNNFGGCSNCLAPLSKLKRL